MKVVLLAFSQGETVRKIESMLQQADFSVYHLSATSLTEMKSALLKALQAGDAVLLLAPLGGADDVMLREELADFLGVSLRPSARAVRKIESVSAEQGTDAELFLPYAAFPARSRAILGNGMLAGCFSFAAGKPLFLLPQGEDSVLWQNTVHLLCRYREAVEKQIAEPRPSAPEKVGRFPTFLSTLGAVVDRIPEKRLCAVLLLLLVCVIGTVGWKMSAPSDAIVSVTSEMSSVSEKAEELPDIENDDSPFHGGTDLPEEEDEESQSEESAAEPSTESITVASSVVSSSSAPSVSVAPEPSSIPESSFEASGSSAPEPVSEGEKEESSEEEEPVSVPEEPSSEEEEESEEEESSEEEEPEEPDTDEELIVRVSGKTVTMDAYELLCEIITNEIGTSFSEEAIKAQTVAAYTFIRFNNSAGSYPSVGLKTCTSEKIKQAVASVLGEAVYYDGKLCNTVYHSLSAGATTSAAEVWGGHYPYLVSVDSSWDEEVASFQKTYRIDADTFAEKVENLYGIDLYEESSDPADWVEIESYNSGNYVGTVSLGGHTTGSSGSTYGKKTITGRSVREKLLNYQLRSHCFTVQYEEDSDELVFETYGYGHGVGMSQWGAQMMALQGYDYEEILTHYYTGVTVK